MRSTSNFYFQVRQKCIQTSGTLSFLLYSRWCSALPTLLPFYQRRQATIGDLRSVQQDDVALEEILCACVEALVAVSFQV
eukprot:m.113294 g.113294  ORF g.113294 m.113294 type:complete len:80 (+) comp37458_c1_seq5:3355-3594(+)